MTLTRTAFETILVRRRGLIMTEIGLDTTIVGTNAALADPMAFAIRVVGGTVADPITVTDIDIATVLDADLDALLDIAELRLLRNMKGNWAKVDTTAGPFTDKFSQLGAALDRDIAALSDSIQETYDFLTTEPSIGVLHLDIATREDDTIV